MIPVINPVDLANKLAAVRRRELPKAAAQLEADPSILELLSFIVWHSSQPGGLESLTEQVIAANPGNIGPAVPEDNTGRARVVAMLRQIPFEKLDASKLLGDSAWLFCNEPLDTYAILCGDPPPSKSHKESAGRELVARLKQLTPELVLNLCRAEAAERLPEYLSRVCIDGSQDFSDPGWWCLRDPLGSIGKYAGIWAERVLGRSAQTAVSTRIADGLDYAWRKRRTVWVDGIHRRGKTWTLEGYCTAYPGRARYVRVPPSDSDSELFRRVARSLGIPYSINAPPSHLRELIADVLEVLGLVMVLDEAQFLYGTRISKTSKPTRLEWCREIIDAGNPCVICTSPQSYDQAEKQFMAKTRYPMGQWLGRWIKTIHIPDLLPDEDLLGVTRKHFPQASDSLLVEIAGRSAEHHGYLKAIEEVRTTAEYLAEKSGAPRLTDRLIRQALDDVLPREEIAPAVPADEDSEATAQPARTGRARAMQPARSDTAGNRFTVPEVGTSRGSRIRVTSEVPA